VNAVVYYRVIDPIKAIINVQNYQFAVSQVAQTSLRSVIGQSDLDQQCGAPCHALRELQLRNGRGAYRAMYPAGRRGVRGGSRSPDRSADVLPARLR
jgi:hypothetical protein